MATKTVEMAVRNPQTKQLIVDEVEVQTVTVNVRNRDLHRTGGHVFNDVALPDGVYFRPGDVKALEISEAEATRLKQRRDPVWELTNAAPTPPPPADDEADEDIREPTSSEASAMAAAAEAAAAELIDDPPRIERVQRRRLR